VLELQGVLFFGSAETLSDEIQRIPAAGTQIIILDLRRVTEIDTTGARILADIQPSLARKNQCLAVVLVRNSEISTCLSETGIIDILGADHVFEDIDRAIEWAEDDLLRIETKEFNNHEIPLAHIDLLSTLTSDEIKRVRDHTRQATYSSGQVIFHEGDPGKEIFILTKGRASAYLSQSNTGKIRLMTFAPGTVFGELAILDAGPRSASVIADDDIICYVLTEKQFAALAKDAPAVAIKLLVSLGRELSGRLRRANRTIHQLES
jgi:SulP family sulfate permease